MGKESEIEGNKPSCAQKHADPHYLSPLLQWVLVSLSLVLLHSSVVTRVRGGRSAPYDGSNQSSKKQEGEVTTKKIE